MAAINDANFFAPGKVVYHVYGHLIPSCDIDIQKHVQKYICLSTASDDTEFRKVQIKREASDGHTFTSNMYLGDVGIVEPGRNPHNLNRVFASMVDALEFIIQIQTNMMDIPWDHKQLKYYRTMDIDGW